MQRDSLKKAILSNVIFVIVVEIIIVQASELLQSSIVYGLMPDQAKDITGQFLFDAIMYASFAIPAFMTIAFMFVTKRESLRVFGGGLGKSMRALAIGLLIGFAINAAISIMTGLSGSVVLVPNVFSPFLLAIIPFCFIQAASEEILDRGFVPAYLEERYGHVVVAVVGSALFTLGHIENVLAYGLNVVFLLNVFLLGVILYLLTKLFENFWAAAGFHFAWNYTQSYLFGLPNSGYVSPFSLFMGTNAQTSFTYDAVFGNEGSALTLVVVAVVVIVLIALLYRKNASKKIEVGTSSQPDVGE